MFKKLWVCVNLIQGSKWLVYLLPHKSYTRMWIQLMTISWWVIWRGKPHIDSNESITITSSDSDREINARVDEWYSPTKHHIWEWRRRSGKTGDEEVKVKHCYLVWWLVLLAQEGEAGEEWEAKVVGGWMNVVVVGGWIYLSFYRWGLP